MSEAIIAKVIGASAARVNHSRDLEVATPICDDDGNHSGRAPRRLQQLPGWPKAGHRGSGVEMLIATKCLLV
jgi:hypothetical protein